MKRRHRLPIIIAATALSPIAIGMTALPAQAITQPQSTSAAKASTAVTVNATQPGTLTIAGHRGLPVTVWTKGTKALTKRPTTTKAITFTGLIGGRAYDVYVGAAKSVRVMTAKAATQASTVNVTAGPIDGSLLVTWQLALPAGTKPANVSYHVVATSKTASTVELTVRGTDHALLTGLEPTAQYTITVTASTTDGTIAKAAQQMTSTVAEVPKVEAIKTAVVEAVVAKPAITTAAPAPAPASAPAAAPAASATPSAPSGPRTRTITVCPDGYTDAGDLCQQTLAYTFHDVTTTSPYTYHQVFVKTGSHFESRPTDWSGTVCYGGTMYAEGCGAWVDDGYYQSVKDNPPTGFSDDGSQYSKTESVKDAIPAGYSDDGIQWVKTAAKVSREVPV